MTKQEMLKLKPSEWQRFFLLPYRKKALAKGIKLSNKNMKRMNGFMLEYAFKIRGTNGINGLFWWTYADNVASLLQKPSKLLQAIRRDHV